MKLAFLPAAIIALALTSCSSTYRGAQTPDDVYYSPAREAPAETRVENRRDRYQENLTYQDDRFLRMKVQNPNRWQAIDDYSYWYDSRYDYNLYNNNYYRNVYAINNWYPAFGYTGFYNRNYFGYGGFYTPVYPVIYYKNPKVYTGVTGKSNLATYTNTRYNNANSNYGKGYGNENNFGNLMKKVFTNPGNNSGNNSSYDRPARTFEPSTTPSNSAGGRSGGYNSSGSSTNTPRPPRN